MPAYAGVLVRAADPIPGKYIVAFKDELFPLNRGKVAKVLERHSVRVGSIYNYAMTGVSVEMSEEQAVRLSQALFVRFVEEESYAQPSAASTWFLDRAARRNLGDPVPSPLLRPGTNGAGVYAYVIDTGVWAGRR